VNCYEKYEYDLASGIKIISMGLATVAMISFFMAYFGGKVEVL
jgi:hypothetical protein